MKVLIYACFMAVKIEAIFTIDYIGAEVGAHSGCDGATRIKE